MYDLQKASIGKRISAWLFDFMMLILVFALFAWIISAITGFDAYSDKVATAREEYKEKYGIVSTEEYDNMDAAERAKYSKFGILTTEGYNALDDAGKAEYADTYNARLEACNKELIENEELLEASNMMVSLTILTASLGLFFAFILMEFVVPLLFGNGQTLGKKIFGIAVMQANGVKIKPVALFVRSMLGKYTLETMIPVLVFLMVIMGMANAVSVIIALGIIVLQLASIISSKTNSSIHDLISSTVAIDYASQMIFESDEALIEYKKKIAAEAAEAAQYK